MKISNEIKKFFENIPYIAFATADKNSNPNVVAIGAKKIVDHDTIWVIDAFFNKTKNRLFPLRQNLLNRLSKKCLFKISAPL